MSNKQLNFVTDPIQISCCFTVLAIDDAQHNITKIVKWMP